MVSFRFLDEVYFANKQTYKSLAIINLYADIILDDTIIGEIQCYYLNSYLLAFDNLDLLQIYLNSLDKEYLELYYEDGNYDEEEFDRFMDENFLCEMDYEDFLNDNNLEETDEYIKNKNNVLFIKKLKLNRPYDFNSIIKDLKYTLYILFDYKDFIIIDNKENII